MSNQTFPVLNQILIFGNKTLVYRDGTIFTERKPGFKGNFDTVNQ
jgi:hypothetical protein